MTRTKPLMVLFVSTGNGARSLIAEALLNAKGSERFTARSAGTSPLSKPDSETIELLEAHKLPTKSLNSKNWRDFYTASQALPVDVIVTLSEEARTTLPAKWLGEPVRVHWTIDDPLSAERADIREWKFRKCYATLEARIDALVRNNLPSLPGELLLHLKDIGMVV